MSYLIADRDYYQPGDTADPGRRFHPGPMPTGWIREESGPWAQWIPAELVLPEQGWKVHVSSSLPRAQFVLAVVSAGCCEFGISFKHLTGHGSFLLLHDKHGSRIQAGK